MKQTAVEWLVEQINQHHGYIGKTMIEEAKEMEKQQIVDAHLDGQSFSIAIEEIDYAEQYYNETFKE
jgi:hypothetical protein